MPLPGKRNYSEETNNSLALRPGIVSSVITGTNKE